MTTLERYEDIARREEAIAKNNAGGGETAQAHARAGHEVSATIRHLLRALGMACFEVEWRTGHVRKARALAEDYLIGTQEEAPDDS
jgi:hypothetical protein